MIIYATITSTLAFLGVILILWLIRENNKCSAENIRRINTMFELIAEKFELEKVTKDDTNTKNT